MGPRRLGNLNQEAGAMDKKCACQESTTGQEERRGLDKKGEAVKKDKFLS